MSSHLAEADLRRFVAGTLAPDDLMRADEHLSECTECRQRAAALDRVAQAVDDLRGHLNDVGPHLTEEELQLFVAAELEDARGKALLEHVTACSTCAEQAEDLRAWSRTPARRVPWSALALAAAILMAIVVPASIWLGRTDQRTAFAPTLPGFELLAVSDQARVRAALDAGVAALPEFVATMRGSRERLMGSRIQAADTFDVISPAGTAIVDDRPVFRWQAVPGASEYTVTVFDDQSTVVLRSPTLTHTEWTPPEPLPRNRTYVWQVTAHRGVDSITAPAAPAPPARFFVIDGPTAEVLRRVEAAQPQSHVLLGILNMNAGVRDAAASHFRQVPAGDANGDLARRSLERLESISSNQSR